MNEVSSRVARRLKRMYVAPRRRPPLNRQRGHKPRAHYRRATKKLLHHHHYLYHHRHHYHFLKHYHHLNLAVDLLMECFLILRDDK